MSLTQLDASAALIVIDLQKGITGLPTVHPFMDIVARAAQLAAAFRERNLPVVLVNVWAELRAAPTLGCLRFHVRRIGRNWLPIWVGALATTW